MTEQTRERLDALQLVLEIIRENGLIVIALAALVWQVWFTGQLQIHNQDRWRTVVDGFRDEIKSDRDTRTLLVRDMVDRISALEARCQGVMSRAGVEP
jgi:hypothetical protein